MIDAPFVTTEDEYNALIKRTTAVFSLGPGGIPGQVFVSGFKKFCFLEFDVMLFDEFWCVLDACAAMCGDQDISVIIHEPAPEAYYFRHFQRYGALHFPRGASQEDYKKAFLVEPEGSPADAFEYSARVISWCGGSQEWGFWGERDLGIGVAATRNEEMSWPSVDGIEWFDTDRALFNLIAPNFANQTIPPEFEQALRSNFQT